MIAFFDCFNGISGDMTVAAFLDAGADIEFLRKELSKLDIDGYNIHSRIVKRSNIVCTQFVVDIEGSGKNRVNSLSCIKSIIQKSTLEQGVKDRSIQMFENLAYAEAKIHKRDSSDIHFHEIGDLDSLIDIVSISLLAQKFDIDEFFCLNLNLGLGEVSTQDGILPLPAPCTLELLKERNVGLRRLEFETVTPTGASIIKTLCSPTDSIPFQFKIERIGYGAGSQDIEGRPNIFRLILAQKVFNEVYDEVLVMETNIDDMEPQIYEHLIQRLISEGAFDVFITPIYMKKNRPGVKLTILCDFRDQQKLSEVVFSETPTTGIRCYHTWRRKLKRIIKVVDTRFGKVRVKYIDNPYGQNTVSPEYEDCKKIAETANIPLRVVMQEAKKQAGHM